MLQKETASGGYLFLQVNFILWPTYYSRVIAHEHLSHLKKKKKDGMEDHMM